MPTIGTPLFWGLFLAGVVVILILDLGVLNRKAHVVRPREAALWVGFCVSLAALFAGWLFWRYGTRVGLEFVTGYLIEYALSVDNLFVFLVVFSYFAVPREYQHRVLFWGIVGALVLRAAFILAGAALLARFHWMIYVFGAFLVVTGVKLLFASDEQIQPERNPILRLVRRFVPVTSGYHGQRFLVRLEGRLWATPLLLVLVVIEATDVVFAVDSIPAIFGVTRDPFIVFTSNIFAILGLRALYFLLADFMNRFHYLGHGLGIVLAFIGVKMVGSAWFKIPIGISLAVIVGVLGASVLLSFLFPPRPAPPPGDDQNQSSSATPSSSR
ncbi:MAG TPA: TerC family protein [Thermoanaerobaculia bacterium]|nr:TerC family protein [Thermoanaerobaculia bacterium]